MDKRDSEVLAAEADARGEVRAGTGADVKLAKYKERHMRAIAKHEDLLELPRPGEALFLLSQKDLNAYTLLLWAIEHLGLLQACFLTSFNVNQKIIRAFAGLLDDGMTERLSLVLSQSVESRLPDRVAELRQAWEPRKDRWRVSLCWNHSKVALLDSGNRKIVITGSGNYSFNAEIEQYEVFADAELHDWLKGRLEDRCFQAGRMNDRHKVWGIDG